MLRPLTSGSVVAGYRVDSLLGEGATGVVYLAHDDSGRAVALKVLAPTLERDTRFRERFLRESAVAASLEHPNVVSVFDAGEAEGLLYLALAWVDGADLRALLRRDGPLAPERAVKLVEDIAAGLDAAHEAGLVHRDVKPANVLVSDEHALLCDFGLAKHAASAESLTGERALVGTLAYVAPEQIEGAAIDRRADVYSLGCVLYECLTGEPPFDRESELATLYAHLNEPPPRPSARRAGLPPALDDVVAAALAKDPGERPATCGALAAAARGALRGEAPWRRTRRPALVGTAIAVAAAGIATAVALTGSGSQPAAARIDVRLGANALGMIDGASGRLVGRVALGDEPAEAVVTKGSTWVLFRERRRVERVDATTRRVAASIQLPFEPGEIASDGRSLWVTEAAGPRIARIGERRGRIERTLRVGERPEDSGPIAAAYGSIWLGRGPEVLRVHRRSGRVLARIATPVEATLVRAADDAVWAVSSEDGRIAKIDPVTGRVVARNQLHGWVTDVAIGGGFAWVAVVPGDVVFKLSADDLSVAGTVRLGDGLDRLSWGAGGLWASSGRTRSLIRLDDGEGDPTRLRVDASPVAAAASGGVLWTATVPTSPPPPPVGDGGELRIAAPDDDVPTDPAMAVGPLGAQLAYATCARLLSYPDAPGAAGRRLVPEVASGLPSLSPNGRTYTFQIRSGFRFSPPSNAPLTADTFRATIERSLSPRLGDDAPALQIMGDVVGAKAYHARRNRRVRGIAVDGERLSITLVRPAGDFPARIAMSHFCAVPPSTPAVPGGAHAPVPSAGPYYVASQEPGRTVLLRNPNYRGARPRHPERIVYTTGVAPDQAIALVDEGRADVVPYDYDHHGSLAVGGRVDRAFGATSAAARRGDRRFFANPAHGVDLLAFNTNRPLFRDVRVRRAVNQALDRRALAGVWAETPTDRYVPPAILPPSGQAQYPLRAPNLRAARRLAAGRGGRAVLYYCGEAGNARVASIVRANLAEIGIRVRIRSSLDCLRGHDPARDAADIAFVTAASWTFDAERFLALAAGDDRDFGGELLPRGWWDDRGFRRRLARADALQGVARERAVARLQDELLRDDVPLAAYGAFVRPEYLSPRVGCRIFQGAYNFLDLGAACVRSAE